jgi:hypothetical protein
LDYLSLGIRLLLVLTFAASAASKVRSRDAFAAFAGSLGALGLLPRAGVLPIAVALVAAEAAAAALLLPEATAVAGLALAAALLAGFSVVILVVTRRGVQAPCRCFGASTRPLGYPHAARNALLAAAALLVVRFDDVLELFAPQPPAAGPDPGSR